MSEETLTPEDLFAPPTTDRSFRRLREQLGRALRLAWTAARRQFLLISIFQVATGAGMAGQVLITKHLLTVLLGERGHVTVARLLPSIALLAVVTIAIRLAGLVATEKSRIMTTLLEAHAMAELSDAATAVNLVDYERPGFFNMLQRAQLAAMTRPSQMVTSLTMAFGAVTGIVGLAGALLTIKPVLVPLLALGAIPVWLVARAASRLLYEFAIAQTERDRQRNYTFILLTHREMAAEVRAFSLVRFLRTRLRALYDGRLSDMGRLVRRRIILASIGSVLSALLTLLVLVLLVWMVEYGHLALASAGAAAGAVFLLGERLHGLGRTSGSVYENTLYMQDFSSFVERWPARPRAADRTPLPAFTELRVEGLWFAYPSRDEPAIEDVSIEIRQGEIVALVGENGSGKTTLAKVLGGLYLPQAGRILWDGIDIRHIDQSSVRRSVAVIFQDYGRYQMTAAENIGFGDVERLADREGIVDAATRAGAHDFIRQLPCAYDNLLGSEYFGGANISIGQWQRIALARAYFRNSSFVILDEPTASLDPRSEAALFQNVRQLYQGRSVLLISHRFSSARTADRIYVLDHGRVVETGSHEQLMRLDGRYAELFKLQAAAYNLVEHRRTSDPSVGS